MVRTPIQQATQGAAHTANHARTLADPRSASDLEDFPELPHSWGERATQMLREIWPELSPKDRESWIVRLRDMETENAAAKAVLSQQHQILRNREAIQLLESWLADTDPASIQEQQETWEYLRQALDEDRGSDQKLFA